MALMIEVIFGIAIVPLLVGIVQVFKMAGLPDRFAPIASLLLGLFIAVLISFDGGEFGATTVLTGLAYGLSASGLYSGYRAVTE